MLFNYVGFLTSGARTLNRFDRFLILRCRTRKAYDAFSKTDRHFGINADRINDFNLHSFLRLDTKGFARFIFIQLAKAELSADHFFRRGYYQQDLNGRDREAIDMGNSCCQGQRAFFSKVDFYIRHFTRFRSICTLLARDQAC